MQMVWRLVLLVALVFGSLSVHPVQASNPAQSVPNCASLGGTLMTPLNGAEICAWMPAQPNGDIVIFGHGYVSPYDPLDAFYSQLILPDASTIPALVTGLGYGFVTTSYRKNGLAVKQGVEDVRDLAIFLKGAYPQAHIYIIGGSEGGLVTTLAIEKYPAQFTAGLAMCGPIGDFTKQINYFGDARVVFDYFFKNPNGTPLIPGSPVLIPDSTLAAWASGTLPAQIAAALAANPSATKQYLNVTGIPYDAAVPGSLQQTVLGVLWYNIYAMNESRVELQGQPFNNKYKWYSGSINDWLLNAKIARFSPDGYALTNIAKYYQTSGRLTKPLVTLHNTQDPADPYWHETLYNLKVLSAGAINKHVNIPVARVGHCNFKAGEAVFAFSVMLLMAGQPLPLSLVQKALPTSEMLQPYLEMQKANPGVSPEK